MTTFFIKQMLPGLWANSSISAQIRQNGSILCTPYSVAMNHPQGQYYRPLFFEHQVNGQIGLPRKWLSRCQGHTLALSKKVGLKTLPRKESCIPYTSICTVHWTACQSSEHFIYLCASYVILPSAVMHFCLAGVSGMPYGIFSDFFFCRVAVCRLQRHFFLDRLG